MEPCPDPSVFAPGPVPEVLLPESFPWLMPAPFPVPPRPDLAPPEGDIANEPADTLGEASLDPGLADSTMPLASAGDGGTTASAIVSSGPRLPWPLELDAAEADGVG